MKAIETTAKIDASGLLTLDKLLEISKPQKVRVIILFPGSSDLGNEIIENAIAQYEQEP